MSQQASHSPAFVTRLGPNNWTEPEAKEEVKKEDFDEDISIEEVLSTM